MAQLQEKILLVTGASQGIGEQVAKAYAAAGATVVLVARHQKKLEKVYDEIVAAGGPEPFAICFDLLSAEEAEFERLAATIAEATGGRLDGIVHCASYFYADGAHPRLFAAAEPIGRCFGDFCRREPQ